MKTMQSTLVALLALLASGLAMAAGADLGQVEKQPTNWVAIGMFGAFVAGQHHQQRTRPR